MHQISALSGIEGHARTARSDAFPCIWRVHGFQNAEAKSQSFFLEHRYSRFKGLSRLRSWLISQKSRISVVYIFWTRKTRNKRKRRCARLHELIANYPWIFCVLEKSINDKLFAKLIKLCKSWELMDNSCSPSQRILQLAAIMISVSFVFSVVKKNLSAFATLRLNKIFSGKCPVIASLFTLSLNRQFQIS